MVKYMKKINLEDIKKILLFTFPKAQINDSVTQLKLGDLEEWDSQGNLNFLLSVEEFYGIRFTMEEMSVIKSIEQILIALERFKIEGSWY